MSSARRGYHRLTGEQVEKQFRTTMPLQMQTSQEVLSVQNSRSTSVTRRKAYSTAAGGREVRCLSAHPEAYPRTPRKQHGLYRKIDVGFHVLSLLVSGSSMNHNPRNNMQEPPCVPPAILSQWLAEIIAQVPSTPRLPTTTYLQPTLIMTHDRLCHPLPSIGSNPSILRFLPVTCLHDSDVGDLGQILRSSRNVLPVSIHSLEAHRHVSARYAYPVKRAETIIHGVEAYLGSDVTHPIGFPRELPISTSGGTNGTKGQKGKRLALRTNGKLEKFFLLGCTRN